MSRRKGIVLTDPQDLEFLRIIRAADAPARTCIMRMMIRIRAGMAMDRVKNLFDQDMAERRLPPAARAALARQRQPKDLSEVDA